MLNGPHRRSKDGKAHAYWSLVETVRTLDGPRQRTICYLGELNRSAHARRVKTVEVFNAQGDAYQLKRFPSTVTVPVEQKTLLRQLGINLPSTGIPRVAKNDNAKGLPIFSRPTVFR